ncbi:MAG: hypothetical protein M1824_003381 [Vezdaea acicularis]|nr:MAG: hypothetical protein M1824_003381 [Vezdaea acicularis]
MANVDPLTNQPYPADAIQRVLFVAAKVHVYQIPPMTSSKGHTAALWTTNNAEPQFTVRLRVLETAIPTANGKENIKTDILLEDIATGELFAAVPYTTPSAVEAAIDSSRFFAVLARGAGGVKALLGVGFEERSDAMDFSISLQEARKVQGLEGTNGSGRKSSSKSKEQIEKKDFSLKEGETITVNIGGRGRRDKKSSLSKSPQPESTGSGSIPLLPPPPSAQDVKAQRRLSRQNISPEPASAADLGFDDGEFGEFQ